MNGSGKQAPSKSALSPAAIRRCPATCPFLGTSEDPYTALAYPSEVNHCFRTDAVAISLLFQQQTCLTNQHTQCARFRDPANIVDAMQPVSTAVPLIMRIALVVVICGLFVTGILHLWPLLNAVWLNGNVLAQVETLPPAAGAQTAAVALPTATVPPTPTLRPTATAVPQPPTPEIVITAVVNAPSQEVRSLPQLNAAVTAVLSGSAEILLTARTADASWGRVRLQDGTTGWINLAAVTPSQSLTTLPVVE